MVSIQQSSQCLTSTCKSILDCYKKSTPVPKKLVDSFGECVLKAVYADFPFQFWREENTELAAIVDTETFSAKSLILIKDMDIGLMSLYLPIFWFFYDGVEYTDVVNIASLTATLEGRIKNTFRGIDPMLIPYPLHLDRFLNLSVKDAQSAASELLMRRNINGSWDDTRELYAAAMRKDQYQISHDPKQCIPLVYEMKLYGSIKSISSVLATFDNVDKSIPDSIVDGFTQNHDVAYAQADEWVLPDMLLGGLHINSAALSAAWIKHTAYPKGQYQMTAGTDALCLEFSDINSSTGMTISSPYCNSMDYTLQSRLFFQWFMNHLDRLETTLG